MFTNLLAEVIFLVYKGNKRNSDNNLITIALGTNNLQIEESGTYDLLENNEGNAQGIYSFLNVNYTSQTHTGKLTITKLDQTNQIVSGTFWFDIEDNGTLHEMREGRFDMQYTK